MTVLRHQQHRRNLVSLNLYAMSLFQNKFRNDMSKLEYMEVVRRSISKGFFIILTMAVHL